MRSNLNLPNGIYIQCYNELYRPYDWELQGENAIAHGIALITDYCSVVIASKNLSEKYNFMEAQEAAGNYQNFFTCPNRHQAIEMYNQRFCGLDAALKMIGGDPIPTIGWTREVEYPMGPRHLSPFAYCGIDGSIFSCD